MLVGKLLELQSKSASVVYGQPFTDLLVLDRVPLKFSAFDS